MEPPVHPSQSHRLGTSKPRPCLKSMDGVATPSRPSHVDDDGGDGAEEGVLIN